MHCVVRGGWVGRSVRGSLFFAVSCFIRTNKLHPAYQVYTAVCTVMYVLLHCCSAVLYVLLHCCSAVCIKGLVGGWVEGALRRPWWVGGPFCTWEFFFCCFLFHKNQPTAPRVPGVYCCTYCCTAVLMYGLLHCCSAVCSTGLVGGWVEGALRRPWWVGGPFCTYVGVFLRPVGDFFFFNFFFCFLSSGGWGKIKL